MDPKSVLDAVEQQGIADRRSLSRAISMIEDADPGFRSELEARFSRTGHGMRIGITGPPGAGKSTLVDAVARGYAAVGKNVAVLAVDPSSPFSGGALLGDRIRMSQASADARIYIRSMASRGALGGLAASTREVVFLLELARFDVILIETVGVGQAEIDIVRTADSVVLVLVPGMGDGVQALKAGIIEIADVFVINKADYPAADHLEKELRRVLSLAPEQGYPLKILRTIAAQEQGVAEVIEEVQSRHRWASAAGVLQERRVAFLLQAFRDELHRLVLEDIDAYAALERDLEAAVIERRLSPAAAARSLLQAMRPPAG